MRCEEERFVEVIRVLRDRRVGVGAEIADQIKDGVNLSTSARGKYLQFVEEYFKRSEKENISNLF